MSRPPCPQSSNHDLTTHNVRIRDKLRAHFKIADERVSDLVELLLALSSQKMPYNGLAIHGLVLGEELDLFEGAHG